MKKTTVFGSAVSFMSSILPHSLRLSVISWLVEHRYNAPGLVFPYAFSSPPKFLVILPEDPLAALHQISGCCALAAHFKNAKVTILCQRMVTPFFKTLSSVQDFIEYDCADRYLFSRELYRIGKMVVHSRYDACIVLDHNPPLSLLYLCGQSAAQLRLGFADAGGHPFFNMQIRPSPNRSYATDQGLLLASMLGAPAQKKTRWTVAKEAIVEVNFLLGEMKVDPASRLVGIDAGYFFRVFGQQWTQSLIDSLRDLLNETPQPLVDDSRLKDQNASRAPRRWYLFSYEEQDEKVNEWFAQQNVPVFSNLPVSRCAALVHKSEFIVAGATVFFELADVLRKPVVGILTDSQCSSFCKESETTRAIRYEKRPDQSVIDAVGQHILASRLLLSDAS